MIHNWGRKRMTGAEMVAKVVADLRTAGCNCDVEVEITTTPVAGMFEAAARHDNTCPLLRASTAGLN